MSPKDKPKKRRAAPEALLGQGAALGWRKEKVPVQAPALGFPPSVQSSCPVLHPPPPIHPWKAGPPRPWGKMSGPLWPLLCLEGTHAHSAQKQVSLLSLEDTVQRAWGWVGRAACLLSLAGKPPPPRSSSVPGAFPTSAGPAMGGLQKYNQTNTRAVSQRGYHLEEWRHVCVCVWEGGTAPGRGVESPPLVGSNALRSEVSVGLEAPERGL